MACAECEGKPAKGSNFPKAVVEILNPDQQILFRKVVVPASMGDDQSFPAEIGKYKNVLLHYDLNNANYLYSSDGIPTLLDSSIPREVYTRLAALESEMEQETAARTSADIAIRGTITALDNSLAAVSKSGSYRDLSDTPTIGSGTLTIQKNGASAGTFNANATTDSTINLEIPVVDSALNTASANPVENSVISGKFNQNIMTDLDINANTSTTTVQLDGSKKNIYTGVTSTKNIALPVASTTQAGVMNSATFDAVTTNTANIEALMNGAVAITGISASPSQADLTNAWEAETGLTTLINRASIYDVTNEKVWTYYTNDTTWHVASNTTQVTVSTFTNSSEGVIKGSTNVGQIFAENDGTGSVNGWDALSNTVASNTSDIAGLQAAMPTVNDATLTIQNNGTNVATFTANSATNTTANIVPPVQIGSVLSTPSSVAYVDTANIIDGAVTTNKFAQNAVNNGIKTANNITPAADTPAAWAAALGGDGLYITAYTTASLFTDQLNLGTAETIVIGNEVVQRWYEESGVMWWRHGSGSTWDTTSPVTGNSFLVVEDSTTTHVGGGMIIPDDADLNTAAYAMTGSYTGAGTSMANCPTDATFRMEVHEIGRRLRVTPTTSDMRLIRVLSDYDGSIFVQRVWSDSQAQWHFDAWRTIAGGNDGLHPYTWAFTPSSNYTVDFGHIYLKSDILLLNIGVHKNSGTIGADEVIGQLANWAAPVHEILASSSLSNASNFVSQAIGYLYIDGKDSYTPANIGQVVITDSAASHTHAKIYIWIPIK